MAVGGVGLGHGGEQTAGVRVLGRLDDAPRRTELDDAAEVHHHDAVGEVPRAGEVRG